MSTYSPVLLGDDEMCDTIKLQPVKDELDNIELETCDDSQAEILEPAEPALLNLPLEIILKICSFLDANCLKHTLSKVCKRFSVIFNDYHLWRYKVFSKIKGSSSYPILPDLKLWEEAVINWSEVCIEMETEEKKWCNVKDTMRHIVVRDVHYASVDTVLLVNKGEICVSGGRDRGMALWNVLDIAPHNDSDNITSFLDSRPNYIRDAHAGWVWDLAADCIESASKVYSASWDNTVKAWDLETVLKCVQTFRCGMSALSVVAHENAVMVGLYSKKVITFDQRAGSKHVTLYKAHRGPVLALKTHKNLVASVSEDKTLAVFDRTAGKVLVSNVKISDKAYPVCISWTPTALYVGDSKGSLHLFHPEDHVYLKTHQLWPEPPVTKPSSKIIGCCQSSGNMIVCSDRGDIKFLYNCYPPQQYCELQTSTYDVTQLQYHNGIMVTGTCDSALEFWVPKERYEDL